MKQLLAGISALAFMCAGTGVSTAQSGTPAWSIAPLTLMEGPGNAYDVTGHIDAEVRIHIDRCSKQWCHVHAGGESGWTDLYSIAFGAVARGPLTGPRLEYKSGGPGTVCLYEGRNQTGASFCGGSGFVVRDLLLFDVDNRYSSVSVEGNVSVLLCRDRDFHSYCERVNDSGNLQGFLDNNVSAMRVY